VGYVLIEGEGLRTKYAGTPALVVSAVDDGPVSVELRFQASLARSGEPAVFTRVKFQSVFEYRWIASGHTYFVTNGDDFEFALIEIIDSGLIASMLDHGPYSDQPRGKRFGGTIDEDLLRHYRIGFDDYGTLDVVCLGVQVDHQEGPGR
jgi:hypothetical protein